MCFRYINRMAFEIRISVSGSHSTINMAEEVHQQNHEVETSKLDFQLQ